MTGVVRQLCTGKTCGLCYAGTVMQPVVARCFDRPTPTRKHKPPGCVCCAGEVPECMPQPCLLFLTMHKLCVTTHSLCMDSQTHSPSTLFLYKLCRWECWPQLPPLWGRGRAMQGAASGSKHLTSLNNTCDTAATLWLWWLSMHCSNGVTGHMANWRASCVWPQVTKGCSRSESVAATLLSRCFTTALCTLCCLAFPTHM